MRDKSVEEQARELVRSHMRQDGGMTEDDLVEMVVPILAERCRCHPTDWNCDDFADCQAERDEAEKRAEDAEANVKRLTATVEALQAEADDADVVLINTRLLAAEALAKLKERAEAAEAEVAKLRQELDALKQRYSYLPVGPCDICWTNSWVPTGPGDHAGIDFPNIGRARCEFCWQADQHQAKLDQARQAIARAALEKPLASE